MENLEQALEKIESGKEKIKRLVEKPLYEGLRLLEDKIYTGPTGYLVHWL